MENSKRTPINIQLFEKVGKKIKQITFDIHRYYITLKLQMKEYQNKIGLIFIRYYITLKPVGIVANDDDSLIFIRYYITLKLNDALNDVTVCLIFIRYYITLKPQISNFKIIIFKSNVK